MKLAVTRVNNRPPANKDWAVFLNGMCIAESQGTHGD